MKDFNEVIAESTCQKRITVCEIYDKEYKLLSRESNRCNPPNGICTRVDVIQTKENYDRNSNCNWTHAEVRSLSALKVEDKPYLSILYGHDFYCDSCEKALREAGVEILEIDKFLDPNNSPELNKLIIFLRDSGWRIKFNDVTEWQYERNYADMIDDEIWINNNEINVTYNDIGWGYHNHEHYKFAYDEFIDWCRGTYTI